MRLQKFFNNENFPIYSMYVYVYVCIDGKLCTPCMYGWENVNCVVILHVYIHAHTHTALPLLKDPMQISRLFPRCMATPTSSGALLAEALTPMGPGDLTLPRSSTTTSMYPWGATLNPPPLMDPVDFSRDSSPPDLAEESKFYWYTCSFYTCEN